MTTDLHPQHEDNLRAFSTECLVDELKRRQFDPVKLGWGAHLHPVMQRWTLNLPLMQQTVLLTSIRGPDGVAKYHKVKYLLRWLRRCVLLSAMDGKVLGNPYDSNGGSFTGPSFDAGPMQFQPGCDNRAEDNTPKGCWSNRNEGPMEMASHGANSVAEIRRDMIRQARNAGWRMEKGRFICPVCAGGPSNHEDHWMTEIAKYDAASREDV